MPDYYDKNKMISIHNNTINTNNKNQTLLSSLMGTWTWSSKLHLGTYDIKSAFVMYITPDPMRQFSCGDGDGDDDDDLKCDELGGQFCHLSPELPPNNDVDPSGSFWKPTCRNMNDTISHYSDALIYYHVSFEIDGNFPIREHGILGTGGWVGPFNVLWAPKNNNKNNNKAQGENSSSSTSRDRYRIRYVETATTNLLSRRLQADNLFPQPIVDNNTFYEASFGVSAVKETIRRQIHLQPGGTDDETGQDPYEDYKKNCNHGNIRPLLPMISFDFVTTTSNTTTNSNTTTTTIEWELDYQTMIAPANTHIPLAKFLPMFARTINSMSTLGITLEGPYCYEEDPDRVWMMKMSQNTSSITKTTVRPTKGCVEGFPCRPEKLISFGGSSPTPQPIVPDNCPQVNLNDLLLWKAATTILILLWTCTILPMVCCGGGNNQSCSRRQQQEPSAEEATGRDPAEAAAAALEEPLLQEQHSCEDHHYTHNISTPTTSSPASSTSSLLAPTTTTTTRESEETQQLSNV